MTVVLLISSPIWGMPLTREPVAMTTAFFACVVVLADLDLRFLPSTPVPLMTVILCFFIRNSTPFEFCSDDLARPPHGHAVVGLHAA